jgi:hypothetical protein
MLTMSASLYRVCHQTALGARRRGRVWAPDRTLNIAILESKPGLNDGRLLTLD